MAIDHFGAGFAGLVLLAQFQPDRIKINRQLVKDIHKHGPKQAIVQAIIKCCNSLEIAISAVGVERAEECTLASDLLILAVQEKLIVQLV